MDGKCLATVNESYYITSNLNDKSDIHAKSNSLCGKVNNVLCYFNKMRLPCETETVKILLYK